MELMKHQIEAVEKAYEIMYSKNLVYIFGQPRVGKSLISLELVDRLQKNTKLKKKAIVFTKKNAIKDWTKYTNYDFDVTNYEQVLNVVRDEYDYVIVDEAHNFSAFPRPSQRMKDMRAFCMKKPIIFLSGTPFVEGPLKAYSQLGLSSWSPFKEFRNCYEFFKGFGIPNKVYMRGALIETYTKGDTEKIMSIINPYIVKVSYKDAGFDYQNEDKVIYIDGSDEYSLQMLALYKGVAAEESDENEWQDKGGQDRIWYEIGGGKYYVLENISASCQFLHRLCGGFYKDLNLPQSKFKWLKDYVKTLKGKTAIMCYYLEEQENIAKHFENNKDIVVLSSTKYCEGIDLSDYNNYILYSYGYSGSKFVQLRDRIVNLKKDRKTEVIIPLLTTTLFNQERDLMDNLIYESVKNKESFNTRTLGGLLDVAYHREV